MKNKKLKAAFDMLMRKKEANVLAGRVIGPKGAAYIIGGQKSEVPDTINCNPYDGSSQCTTFGCALLSD